MTIPPNVLNDVLEDLAALKLAGEASPGTRSLLDNYAGEHPEFAARMKASASQEVPRPPVATGADDALRVLKHTRQFIRLRTLFTGIGIAFTLLPLSFTFGPGGVRMLFFHDQPGLVWACWSLAVASWVAGWLMGREIGKTGL